MKKWHLFIKPAKIKPAPLPGGFDALNKCNGCSRNIQSGS